MVNIHNAFSQYTNIRINKHLLSLMKYSKTDLFFYSSSTNEKKNATESQRINRTFEK